jgi:mRNA interferase RelE/StbE
VVARIRLLADDPRPPNSQKLSGADKYRFRQGRYRSLYTIEDDRLVVTVVRAAHRKAAYR